jgi:P-type Cu+ transporter
LAQTIVRAAREKGLALDKAENFDSGSGMGGCGQVAGRQVALGNTTLMEQLGVPVTSMMAQAETLRTEGASVMHLAINGKLMGLLAVSDPIKASTSEALATLRSAGLRIVMATGDGLTTAKAVGAKLLIFSKQMTTDLLPTHYLCEIIEGEDCHGEKAIDTTLLSKI